MTSHERCLQGIHYWETWEQGTFHITIICAYCREAKSQAAWWDGEECPG